jgi:hypothetical protein
MCLSGSGLVVGIYVLSGSGLVVGSYVPFWSSVGGWQLCAFQVGGCF